MWSRHILGSDCILFIELEDGFLLFVEILPWICSLVFEDLDEAVEGNCDQGAKQWTKLQVDVSKRLCNKSTKRRLPSISNDSLESLEQPHKARTSVLD